MKLQYLGDARDAFKWDLLHWICTKSSPYFDVLAFVPMLTPDIENSNEGHTPHQWFKCRDFIRPFVTSLKKEPRSLEGITALGSAEQNAPSFRVSLFAPSEYIGSGNQRAKYWASFEPERLDNAVVFFDPDNGFETKTQHGRKWVRHLELRHFLSRLPKTSAVVVYQHRPRRKWIDLFADLKDSLGYAHTAVAAHEGNLAFVAMAGNASAGRRIFAAIESYANEHPVVCHALLRGNPCLTLRSRGTGLQRALPASTQPLTLNVMPTEYKANPMTTTCIYCCSEGPFSLEHPLPACLGEFRGEPLIAEGVCKSCNGAIGQVEEQFCRAGPEAFFRQYYGVLGRDTHHKVNPFDRGSAGAPAIDLVAAHLGLGVEILWQFNPGERTVREVRQVVVVDTSGVSHPIRIQSWMSSPDHLKQAVSALGIKAKDVYVFADDDEKEWVIGLTKGISTGVAWTSGQPTETVSDAAARVQVTDKYFRTLAKIGFHYLLASSTKVSGGESEFSAVRQFIRHGGNRDDFFREDRGSIIQRESDAHRPDRPIHIVLVEWTEGSVQAKMQFFLGPDYDPPIYRIDLARGVAALGRSGAVGHAYAYFENGSQGKYVGDVSEILVQPNDVGGC